MRIKFQATLKALQVAIKKFAFLLLIWASTNTNAQKLNGKYKTELAVNSVEEIAFKDGRFTQLIQTEGNTTTGRGTYTIEGRKLIFNYEKIINKDSTIYTIGPANIKRGELEVRASNFLQFKLFDELNASASGYILLVDAADDVIASINTDKNGNANMMVSWNKGIAAISVFKYGYFQSFIPIHLLRDDSNIRVEFKPWTGMFYVEPHKEAYEIFMHSVNEFTLESGNSKRKYKSIK